MSSILYKETKDGIIEERFKAEDVASMLKSGYSATKVFPKKAKAKVKKAKANAKD